ncbi:MAG: HAMP domain-containing histidine kinase [Chromatiales bacterium]|nr:MAG: HAMP domain-containing histidine kinase [Chromatiales bacterium]
MLQPPKLLAMALAQDTLKDTLQPGLEATPVAPPADTARRIERLVAGFRLLVGLVLVVVALVSQEPPLLEIRYTQLFLLTGVSYSLFAAAVLALPWRHPTGTMLVDVVAITLLMHAGGGISSGLGALLVVMVGAASLNLSNERALLAAAISALAVLGEQTLAYVQGLSPANAFVPAGMLGAIIFLVAATASPLARRLRESEALALQRGIDLANLAQLNDYVIQNLRESLVVVDEADEVRLINQSAAELLGTDDRVPGRRLAAISSDLGRVLRNWRAGHTGPDATLGFPAAGGTARINTYIAPLEGREDGPVLMFLEDASLLAEKVRQTKLVSLGRLSASIAHEIRNPVGALSHAAQLLRESPAIGEDEQRLLEIIDLHSQRVSEIVENVMQLSRRDATRPESIALTAWMRDFVAEFASTCELPAERFVISGGEPALDVRIDPSHLRQVCWNLCENAVQHATRDEVSDEPIVEIRFGQLSGTGRPFVEFADRGPGIDREMRERLFEPFATGLAGGTGLGLFISRELCECNRATLVFEPRGGGGSIFRIVFADPRRWEPRT